MTDIIMSCLRPTEKQKQALARMLGLKDVENFDIDRETANHFLKELYRKRKHLTSELEIEC